MFFRSERLFLRPGWPEDWSEIFARIVQESAVQGAPGAHLQSLGQSLALEAEAVARLPGRARFPHFLVTLPGGDGAAIVGCIGLSPEDGEAELGYWIAAEHAGKGYATEAARAVLSLARTLGHPQVTASEYVDSPGSAAVLRKVGFRPTGTTRPRFSIGRGGESPALIHVAQLGARSDCDGTTDDDGPAMRAA
jgi:Acetyltransferases, including N-acetylases of ribosomal proteins